MSRHSLATALTLLLAAPLTPALSAQATQPYADRIRTVIDKPEFHHAIFGIEIYSLDHDSVLFAYNGNTLFVPGSTTKMVTEGTSLGLLSPDFRFHTRIYRTGPLRADGTLDGDLVLLAGGDPDLSGRLQPDGTLAFENEDHSYDGSPDTKAVPGDPLLVIRELAAQVAAHHVTRITGRVIVDTRLFAEGERELGTGVVLSPVVVNDNLVDVTLTPGHAPGEPMTMKVSPVTAYAHFVNHATTAAAGARADIRWASDTADANGFHTITIGGSMPAGGPSILYSYAVPQPSRFAEVVLAEALRERGVKVSVDAHGPAPDTTVLARSYTPNNLLAEHVSPPLIQDVHITLKVSQNLHASMMPYLLGAFLAHQGTPKAGFHLEHDYLTRAGLDLGGASQSDGAGGSAHFSPDFMVHYLAFISRQSFARQFYDALPILGRDGTLWNIQTQSPAAGQVHAKTGTYADVDLLNDDLMLDGKGLAGYMTTAGGQHLAFALYLNNVGVSSAPNAIDQLAGQALGALAAMAYDERW